MKAVQSTLLKEILKYPELARAILKAEHGDSIHMFDKEYVVDKRVFDEISFELME